jgi:ABC-type nitrate/sulfonate/bicarbonate transport system permease component
VMIAQQSLRIDVMYAYLVWLALLGIVVNALLRLADREKAA